ncbi:MAG: hypothetical protein JXA46_12810 [Dehalococcoidales bacterium]|nr:hypothetical protein [Dehalococcoidales bacterium]
MAETKYGKYFFSGLPPGVDERRAVIASLDGDIIKGSNSYVIHWVPRVPDMPGVTSWDQMRHGPHIHKEAELIIHIGTNPDDPMDLGAEVEFCMGPEMEKHIITQSTVVYIPPGFIHCPWTIKRVDRPFILMQVNQEPKHTEKSYPQIVSPEEREHMMFLDEGYDSLEKKVRMPKGLNIQH